jgi:hypothetical protein
MPATRPVHPLILWAICALIASGCAQRRIAPLEHALAVFGERRFEDALPLLEQVVAGSPRDATARCWLAETKRRLGRQADAVRDARTALAIDPHSSFAHVVLADCYDPVMSGWEGTNADSTWTHNRQAAMDDPRNGDAWLSVWKHAVARGDSTRERASLRQLYRIGYFTPAVLAYNRWQLEHLPSRAALLTQGDMDTYPAAALQAAEGVRSDVAIVNLSLLNWPDYALAIGHREGLPLPQGIDSPQVRTARAFHDGREPTAVSDRVVSLWVTSLAQGKLGRPVSVAASASAIEELPVLHHRLTLAGPYYEVARDTGAALSDLTLLRKTMSGLVPSSFAGFWVSTLDQSPIRASGTSGLGGNLIAAALRWGHESFSAGDRVGARAAVAKIDSLVTVLGTDEGMGKEIARLRERTAPQ